MVDLRAHISSLARFIYYYLLYTKRRVCVCVCVCGISQLGIGNWELAMAVFWAYDYDPTQHPKETRRGPQPHTSFHAHQHDGLSSRTDFVVCPFQITIANCKFTQYTHGLYGLFMVSLSLFLSVSIAMCVLVGRLNFWAHSSLNTRTGLKFAIPPWSLAYIFIQVEETFIFSFR